MSADKAEFWNVWNSISHRVPMTTPRDKSAAVAGAFEMFKAMKAKEQEPQPVRIEQKDHQTC
jgi:hypothetical protein